MGGNNFWGHLRRPSANADWFPPAHFPALGPVYCSDDSSLHCFPWGTFGSLTDLAVRISLPVIFLLKVLLPNLVTDSLCRAVMRNRPVGRGHLCLTYSANSCYPIFDGPASPGLPGVYHLTLLSQECSSFTWDRWQSACELWRGQNGVNTCTDADFPTSFSFWTNLLSLGMHVVYLQWYLRVRLFEWKWKVTTIGKAFWCCIEINISLLSFSLVTTKWWEREKRLQSSGWKRIHEEIRKFKRSVIIIIMGFPK